VNSENYNLLTVKIRITGISFILLAVAISSSEQNFFFSFLLLLLFFCFRSSKVGA
jgi:multisubunit Na+/H+ antiporter MnhG subunit